MPEINKIFNIFYKIKQEFGGYIADFLSYWSVRIYLLIILVINIIIWVVAVNINNKIDTEKIALHYNVDFGIILSAVRKRFI